MESEILLNIRELWFPSKDTVSRVIDVRKKRQFDSLFRTECLTQCF